MQINTGECEFRKEERKLVYMLGHTTYPVAVNVVSHHTGKVVRFIQDIEAAMKNEFWDGMECHYVPTTHQRNVDTLVLCAEGW